MTGLQAARKARNRPPAVRRKSQPKWLADLVKSRNPLFVVDGSQRIVLWNRGAEGLMGYHEAEVLGQPCYRVMAGTRCGKTWCHANCMVQRNIRRGLLPGDFDLLTRTGGGEEVWVNVSILVLPNERERLALHLLREVTDQVKAMERLDRVREAMEPPIPGIGRKPRVGETRGSLSRDALSTLSHREVEVLSMLAEGFPSQKIARAMGVSIHTVRTHIRNALRKLGLHSKAEAVSFAFRNGLI